MWGGGFNEMHVSRDRRDIRFGNAAARTLCVLLLLGWAPDLRAQRATGLTEHDALAQAWTMLAQKDLAKASELAARLLKEYPRSAAVLVFAVDATIARQGATAGLDTYEYWLGAKSLDDAYVLRRVAHAFVREAGQSKGDPALRAQALGLLAAEGDRLPDAGAGLSPDAAVLAGMGTEQDVESVITALKAPGASKHRAIAALAKSRSPRAAEALIPLLKDPDPGVRAAAAEALGTAGATDAVPHLKPLLDDPLGPVHLAAAGALLALDDPSGLALLRKVQSSEHAGVRLAAAQAMRGRPDTSWMETVRALTRDADPEVRRQAAELIAPHDPQAARAVLEPLLQDPNPGQREAAAVSFVQAVAADVAELRRFLRSGDPAVRLEAARQILERTR
jgi:HEAT repeat protein